MTPIPPDDQADLETIAKALGVIAGLWAFAKLVLKPVVRSLWREVHADEVKKWDDTSKLAERNNDRLEWIEESIKAQGQEQKDTVALIRAIARDVNRIIGRLDGPPWDGHERRHEVRRQEDEEREA